MTVSKSIVLIPAAGAGKRMGASINKQYLLLDGMPVVARTIAVFEQSPLIDAIYLVVPAEEISFCREHIVEAFGFSKIKMIIAGGRERQNSVMNGLESMRRDVADDDVVLIHDGVRPLITESLLRDSITAARCFDGALVAVPVKDTIKIAYNDVVVETPIREALWQAQTPQSFRFGKIYAAHLSAKLDNFIGTDDSSLVERTGGKVHVIQGSYCNIKITTPEDLILAEAFLRDLERERIQC